MSGLLERCAKQIAGVLACPDRVVIPGTLPTACDADGRTRFLSARKIRIFDDTQFTKPLKDGLRENAERTAAEAGVEIEFLRKRKSFRKEDRIGEILKTRGDHPGLVHVFSARERCTSYQPWHDQQTYHTFLKPDGGKCLHYYFYFIDEQLGLCDLRVPTCCPFRLQFTFNGHNWPARQLDKQGIGDTLRDNAFGAIDDWDQAPQLAGRFDVRGLHRRLDQYAARLCPVEKTFGENSHWSLMQSEYATDVVFGRAEDLAPVYEEISRTAIHAVKVEQVASGQVNQASPAPVQKTIDSLPVLAELCRAANRRSLAFVSVLADPSDGVKKMRKIAQPVREASRNDRGFNLLAPDDQQLFQVIARGEHHISGFTNRSLRTALTKKSSSQISRLLKRLRTHGLIKKIGRTDKYSLTKLGQAAVIAATKLRETVLIPAFTQTANA